MIPANELKAACRAIVDMFHDEVKPALKEFDELYNKIVAPAHTERALGIVKKYRLDKLDFSKGHGIDGAYYHTHVVGIPNTTVSYFGYSESAYKSVFKVVEWKRDFEAEALWMIVNHRWSDHAQVQGQILEWRKNLMKLRDECRHLFADSKTFVRAALDYMKKIDEIDAHDDDEFRRAFGIQPKPRTYKVTLRIEEV